MPKKHLIVDCDKCRGRFKLKPKTEKMKDGIERVHFTCKHCKHNYTAYYTNNYIKEKQKEIKTLNYQQLGKKRELEREVQAEMDNLRKECDTIK